jgi:excisionase family DNA binding protein
MSVNPQHSAADEPPVRLFTISEAAALLNVPDGWLRKKVSARDVPHTRLGKHVRFTPEHLRAVITAGESGSDRSVETAPRRGLSQRSRRSLRAS